MKSSAEQWKLNGNCTMCRRRTYCKTICRARRESSRYEIQKIIEKATGLDKINKYFSNS